MADRRLRVVVVAEEAAGVQVLRGLFELQAPPEIVAVMTRSSVGGARRPIVYESAKQLGLDVWPSTSVRTPELATRLRSANVDLLVNVHSLFLIHPSVLAAPAIGSFNLHPGPLPGYAGLNAPSWAIYSGEPSHAVTLHWMDAGIDTGPIAYEQPFELDEDDTGLTVSGKCVRLGVPLVLHLVEVATTHPEDIPRIRQDSANRRYFPQGPPEGGRLDWARPARQVERLVRAADYGPFPSPWGHPMADLSGHRVGIAKASLTGAPTAEPPGTVHEVTESGALVATRDELIRVERLWLDGRYLEPPKLLGALG